ncbi:MAG: ABC transporter permease [Gammaproteobacteria bacterium]
MIDNFALVLQKYGGLYLEGLALTVELTLLSLAAGFILAWPLALALQSRRRAFRFPARALAYYATGTPLLVQLFLVYFGLGQFEAVRESPLWIVLREPYWCALIAFSLNTAAYSAVIFAGALNNAPSGEAEAARSCGLSVVQTLALVSCPLAFRRALPAYGNEMIFLLHGSSLASVVTLLDLTGAARVAARGTFAFSESYLTAIILYMGLTALLVFVVKWAERRMSAHIHIGASP